MKMIQRAVSGTAVVPMAIATFIAVGAQGVAAQEAGEGFKLEEIIVTASKREESLRDVAQSVTALTEEPLQRLQVIGFEEYAKVVPGLSIATTRPGNSQLILRGINAGGAGSTVATYVDETPFGSSSALANGVITTPDIDPADLQRIEVLRGPQGTLYGASTEGGLLKFVTHAPDLSDFSARVQLGAEDVADEIGWSARGMVNVPFGDTIALRVNAQRRVDAGYVNDPTRGLEDVNESRTTGGRAALLFAPTDAFSLRLSALAQDTDTDASNSIDLVIDPIDPDGTGPLTRGGPVQPLTPLRGDLDQSRRFSEYSNVQYRIYNGTADWDLGWATLVSATSYGTFEQESFNDNWNINATLPIQINTLEQEKFTQEARLASPVDERLDWLVGVYYTRETGELLQRRITPATGAVTQFNLLDSVFKETAGFATLTYHLTSRFDVAFGGRFARNEQSLDQTGNAVFTGESSEDVWTYSVAPRWRPTDWATVYARVAKGYRPGGPNILPPSPPAGVPTTFEADSILSYETGVKADLFEQRFSVDVSAYFIDWSNVQLITNVGGFSINGNGGSARSQGLEWTATMLPIEGLTVTVAGAYTDAELSDDTGGGVLDPTDFLLGRDGDPLPNVPKWSGSVNTDYQWTIFGAADAFVGATWSYVDERYTNIAGRSIGQVELPSYDTVDLRAGVNFERWSVQIYGKNITDERAVSQIGTNRSPAGGGTGIGGLLGRTASILRPRTIGIMTTVRF